MHTVPISEETKELIARRVADGLAASETEFVEEAVRCYAAMLQDDENEVLAAAEEGIAAIERRQCTTISGPDDLAALRDRVWTRATELAKEMTDATSRRADEAGAKAAK